MKKKKFDIKTLMKEFDAAAFMTNNAMIFVILSIILFTGFTKDNFFTVKNAMNILSNTSVRFIIALGVSGALITRGTDLSAGRLVGLSAIVSATMTQRPDFAGKFFPGLPDLPIIVPFLIVLTITMLIGTLNGLVIAYLNVPPFLATLGMQIMIYGVNIMYSRSEPIGTLKPEYTNIGQGKFLGSIPYVIIIALLVGVIMWILYTKTRYGKYMYAIGGNEQAAEVSGVNVKFAKVKIYALAGLLYGLAGFLLTAKSTSSGPNSGMGYELEAIAAATIGGVSTAGGEGRVQGIFMGVFVFELLKTALNFLGVKPEITYIVQGLVIIIAVALDIRKTQRRK
ncbi:MAG: beta-methylgalactoside transporter [Erysipelothrix sp.]|nr:beta-methylgalactoside transporter [Erysipelothrix sp.]